MTRTTYYNIGASVAILGMCLSLTLEYHTVTFGLFILFLDCHLNRLYYKP